MSLYTKLLNLFKWDLDNPEDLESNFNIEKSLNENWDKIDKKIEELEEKDKAKVDKKEGYKLSQEDFTTILKNKLLELKNYDDSALRQIIDGSIKNVTLDPSNGHIIFHKNDGTTAFIDTALELIIESGIYDKKTKKIILTLANKDVIEIPLLDLLTDLYSKSEIDEILSEYETRTIMLESEVFEKANIKSESNTMILEDTEECLNIAVNEIESNKMEQAVETANLIDNEWESGTINYSGIAEDSETVIRSKNFIRVYPGHLYKISRTIATDGMGFRFYNSDKSYFGNQSPDLGNVETNMTDNVMKANQTEMEMTILKPNIAYMKIIDLSNDLNTIYTMTTKAININYPSEVKGITGNVNLIVKNNDNTKNQEVTLSLGDKTLYKGDKILRKNGKWYFDLKWNIINDFTNLILEGLGGGSYRARLSLNNKIVNISHIYLNKSYSNILNCISDGQTYNKIEGFTISSPNPYTTPQMFLYIKEFENYTKEQYIQVLNNLQAYFVVPLKEEDLEEILDSTLINQLNKLLRLKQYEEVTNIDFSEDVIFEIDVDKSEIRVLKETNIAQNIEIEKLKEDINYRDKIISGLQGGQVEELVEGDNITIQDCLELPVKLDKIYGKEVQCKSDYVELEYIESTGSQYIDTGVKATGKTTVDIDFVYIPSGNNIAMYRMLLGLRESNLNFLFCINENGVFGGDYKAQSNLNIPDKTFDFTVKNNLKTKINNNKYELYINDTKEKEVAIQDFSSTINMYMFAFNWDSEPTTRAAKFRFYKCKIYDDDILIRDFIPCKRKIDNAIGFYDLVEGKFYGNIGIGNFVSGKELLLLNELNWGEGNQEILHINENLIDIKPYLYHLVNSNNISIDVIGNDIILNGTPTTNYVNLSKAIDVTDLLVDGEKYTLYRENDYSAYLQVSAQKYDNSYVYYALNTSNVNYKTFTIDKSTYKRYTIALQLNVINAVGTLNNYVVKSMLIRGNEIPQKYVYNKSKTFELTNLPALYSEDDYIYYDEISKKYLERNEWNKYILTGNEAITTGSLTDENLIRFEIRNAMNGHEIHNNLSAICNFATVSNDIKSGNIRFGVAENANTLVYYINKNIFPTTTVFKNFIKQKYESGNPLYVIYKTENPTEKEITEPVLIEQLDKIRAIFTYKGTNHFIITSENGQSANLKLIAYKDGFKILNDKINNLEQALLNS